MVGTPTVTPQRDIDSTPPATTRLLGAGGHARGSDGDGLLAGPAEAVERHAGHGLGPAREEDREAGDVVAVVPGEDAVARDHVVDAAGSNPVREASAVRH